MQIWNGLRGDPRVLSTLLSDRRYPRKPSRTRRIKKLVSPPNGGNRYGVRLTAYFKVCPFMSTLMSSNFLLGARVNEYVFNQFVLK